MSINLTVKHVGARDTVLSTRFSFHVSMQCTLYADLRQKMSDDVLHFNAHFSFLSDADNFLFLFSKENVFFYIVAKVCYTILIKRNSLYTICYCVNNM